MTPPADGIRSLRPDAPPVSRCGAVVLELARPGCAPNAATVEAVTAAGARPAERWRRTAGATKKHMSTRYLQRHAAPKLAAAPAADPDYARRTLRGELRMGENFDY